MGLGFLRTDHQRFHKLGKLSRKKQKWRRARGIHNKLRLRRAGHPQIPSPGFKKQKTVSGKIDGMTPVRVFNVNDMQKLGKNNVAIMARVGARNKIAMLKFAQEKNIKVLNAGGKR